MDVDVGLSRYCGGRVNSAFVPLKLVLLLVLMFWPGGRVMPGPGPARMFVFGGPVEAGRRLRVCWKRLRRTEDWDMFGMVIVCETGIGAAVMSCDEVVCLWSGDCSLKLVCLSAETRVGRVEFAKRVDRLD